MRGILRALLLSLAIISLAGCGTGVGTPPSRGGSLTAPIQVSLSDAPADQLLSFQFTLNSIVLTSTSGSTVGVLPTATTVEISHLQATAQPVSQLTVPQGTYTSGTASISNASATFVNSSGKIAQVNFSGTFNVPLTFSPNLVVGTTPVALNLDLNLASSLQSLTSSGFAPAVTATINSVPATNQQEEGNGGVHDLTGVIGNVSSGSFTLAASQVATSLTIAVNANTQFVGVSGPSGLAAGDIVEIDAAMQSDNTLLASKVEAEIGVKQEAEGVVVSRTAGSGATPNTFTIAVQNSAGAGAPSPGTLLTVGASNTTTFILPSDEANLAGLLFTPAFSSFANLAVGQRVEVRTTSDFTAIIAEVKLGLQTFGGTPNVQTGNNQFTLALPAGSAFSLLTGASSIDLIVQPTTEFKGISSIVLSSAVHARGLLLFDTPSGRYKLVATRVTP